jgi:malate permease and related proteins
LVDEVTDRARRRGWHNLNSNAMSEFTTVLNAVIPVFAIMAAGLGVRRLNWLSEEADRSLFRVVVNFLMPCLILDTVMGNPAARDWRNLTLAPAIGFANIAASVGLAWLVSRWLHFPGPPTRRTFAITAGLQNYGYIPLPLTLLLFDERTTGILFLHNLGAEACLWTVVILLITGGHAGRAWRQVFNAPLIAILLALALNFSGTSNHLPAALTTTLHLLGQCAFPLGLLLVGATIADHLGELRSGEGWWQVAAAIGLRMAVFPAALVTLAIYLPASIELKRVLIIEAAMPSAVLPIILARHYGGDPGTALRIVLGTSLISLATTPIWIRFGLKWLAM